MRAPGPFGPSDWKMLAPHHTTPTPWKICRVAAAKSLWVFLHRCQLLHKSWSEASYIMWVTQCHKPAMTGNGNHTTHKNGDDWGMVYYCFTHIILIWDHTFLRTPINNGEHDWPPVKLYYTVRGSTLIHHEQWEARRGASGHILKCPVSLLIFFARASQPNSKWLIAPVY